MREREDMVTPTLLYSSLHIYIPAGEVNSSLSWADLETSETWYMSLKRGTLGDKPDDTI